MTSRRLVTVVGATGAQGGAIVRSLLETQKYKIRGLTRDPTSEKAHALKSLSDNIDVVKCNITKKNKVEHAFKDSWAVFVVTDFWAQPDKPEVEIQQGTIMADVAASLQIPYYIFSTVEDIAKEMHGKLNVPHVTQKAEISDYIKEKYPELKTIFIQLPFYMQKWKTYAKLSKLDDGTAVFSLPMNETAKLRMVNVDNVGPIVREILENPEAFVGQAIRISGDEIAVEDIPKVFTKVTGIPAIFKTLTSDEFRTRLSWLPKIAVDDLLDMYKWVEIHRLYQKDLDWTNGQKITKLNTFEEWLIKTDWKGE